MSSSVFLYDPSHEFDRLFSEAFDARLSPFHGAVQRHGNATGDVAQALRPRLDLHENVEANTVTATFELPGLTKENVDIHVHDGRLHISGESKISADREESGYAVRERRYGKFSRTLKLPYGVKEGEVIAKMDNGILTVTFPRSTPETAPKKIAVE
ncbi:HSP20-like chaperone [Amanita rubescens]|nr:HSP20-like chaperone [Amanita rubescens]KAF8348002.1 HSP20-like chaperone [Amanita rubescens]